MPGMLTWARSVRCDPSISIDHSISGTIARRSIGVPLNQYRYGRPEKYEWVERHLGSDFVHRIIVTKNKTVVHGDVLVHASPIGGRSFSTSPTTGRRAAPV